MRKQCSRDRKDRDNCSGSDKRSGRNNSSRGRGRHRENETDEVVIGNPRDAVQAQVITLLKELQEKMGLSYLFISHDLDVVRWFCDEIAVMEEGKFVETGRAEDVIGNPKVEFTKKLVENFILR